MAERLPPLRLTGATVLRDGVLQDRTVAIADGRIAAGPFPAVDLAGYWILPGIVDLHGAAFERHLEPRDGARVAPQAALAATDREAAANGVTTAWLAQGWSWEGGLRAPDRAEALLHALEHYRSEALVDLRVQLRYQTHEHDSADRLLAAVRRHGVDLVLFDDGLASAQDARERQPLVFAAWAARRGRSVSAQASAMERARARGREVPRRLCRMAEVFDTLGVCYGSHDDPDGETREYYSMLGARICEFPRSFQAAAVARAVGDPVVAGAPDLLLEDSQGRGASSRLLIRAGKCDALVSGDHYPSLTAAAFALVDQGLADLPRAWRFVSEAPAEILRLPDRGMIAPGKRADLAIVCKRSRRVEATISDGRLAWLGGPAALRFLSVPGARALAAE